MNVNKQLIAITCVIIMVFSICGISNVYAQTISVQQTTDGGYIIGGTTTTSSNGFQFCLIKTNAAGNKLWSNTYGGSGEKHCSSAQQTADGGYIMVGSLLSSDRYSIAYLVKTDANGKELWSKTFNKTVSGGSVQQTTDGGYIITGDTIFYGDSGHENRVYLLKTDASGNELWSKGYGGNVGYRGQSVQQTTDGGYIVAGGAKFPSTLVTASDRVYLLKTDASGNELWSKTFYGDYRAYGYPVKQTTDGGYIVAGWTEPNGYAHLSFYIVKTDANGKELWSKTFRAEDTDSVGYSVQQTTDGGYIVLGSSCDWPNHVCLLKTDANGKELWHATYQCTSEQRTDESPNSVQQTTDGGYIVAGATSQGFDEWQIYLLKTNAAGGQLWNKTFAGSDIGRGQSVQQTTDGGYIVKPPNQLQSIIRYNNKDCTITAPVV